MSTVLIGAGPLRGQPGFFRDRLREAGFQTVDPPGAGTLGPEDLLRWLPGCSAVVAGGEGFSAEVVAAAEGLRVIARVGVGYDAVDLRAADARGVVVTITPGTNHESVAEQAFALLLAVARRVATNDRTIRAGGWDRTIVEPIRGRRLGLVGLGRIGRAMVPRALAFGMEVLAHDPAADPEFVARNHLRMLDLDDLIAQADVLSLHLPALPTTRHLIGPDRLARMPRGGILLNTARGSLVDEEALYRAIASGHLAGAGLDVLEAEPPPADHPLLGLPGVVFSPHIGGVDRLALDAMAESAARSIIELSRGEWPAGCVVNEQLRPGWRW